MSRFPSATSANHGKSASINSFHTYATEPLSSMTSASSRHQHSASLNNGRAANSRTLKKQSSLADFGATIKTKFRRKWIHKDVDEDLEWGCAGENEFGAPAHGPSRDRVLLPGFELEQAPAPKRPPPVNIEQSCWTKEQLRDAERKQDEQRAQEALAAYFSQHTLEDTTIVINKGKVDVASSVNRYEHSRTGSTSSSASTSTDLTSASRPLTNESLPSYHSTPDVERVATIHIRRPKQTLAPAYQSSRIDTLDELMAQPRAYAYI
ncbi:hypothetical protein OIO90_006354 [Microbotryomycetes sp. JL221]|nr:hypothetical protein OIO90_006354 [Microbotryomycetes sp. JL221]